MAFFNNILKKHQKTSKKHRQPLQNNLQNMVFNPLLFSRATVFTKKVTFTSPQALKLVATVANVAAWFRLLVLNNPVLWFTYSPTVPSDFCFFHGNKMAEIWWPKRLLNGVPQLVAAILRRH